MHHHILQNGDEQEQDIRSILFRPVFCPSLGCDAIFSDDKVNGDIIINRVEAKAIKAVISLYDKGRDCAQIADLLKLTDHRTITGRKFYPAAVQAIIDKRKVYEGETGYPPILQKKSRRTSVEEKKERMNCSTATIKEKKTPVESRKEKINDTVLKTVRRILRTAYKEMTSEEIQLKSGIKDYAVVVEILNQLVRSGEIVRVSSRYNRKVSAYIFNTSKMDYTIPALSSEKKKEPLSAGQAKQTIGQWRSLNLLQKDVSFTKNEDRNGNYDSVDEFLVIVKEKGIRIKDNRQSDGCVWVKTDDRINDIISKVQIKGRRFRRAEKCKAFNGESGWYY